MTDVYQLRISLLDAVPPIWRRVVVPGDTSLRYLHYLIQAAMGWQDYHLYEFAIDNDRYGEIDDDAPDYLKAAVDSTLTGVIRPPGSRFLYTYDFGDEWVHSLDVEAILPAEMVAECPACIDGARACPPEDFGGAFTYSLWLRKMGGDSIDQDDLDALEEYPGFDFDPEKFSAKMATRRMKRVATSGKYRTWH